MVLLPPGGGFWLEDSESGWAAVHSEVAVDEDDTAKCYRTHFLGHEHFNFTAADEEKGPVVVSLKEMKLG
jgi:RAP1 GTPase activating protein 1